MKKVFEKLKKSKVFWISLIIIIQTVVYVVAGMGKAYIHMDEAYSLGLSNYERTEIQDSDDFYNQWHGPEYYEDYLVVNEDERGDFSAVYNNQRDDVHPPVFYLLLRLGMELTPEKFTKWTGIILNILAFAVNAVFLYLVVEKLLIGERNRLMKAAVLTLAANVTIAAIGTVIYIRMYALLTMWVTIAAYLHLLLLDSKKVRPGLIAGIGLVTVLGFLTQYYFLFFIAPMFVVMAVHYIKAKQWKEFWVYFGGLAGAAILSLIVWPWSIKHLFFGYRGQGVMSNLTNFAHLGEQLGIFAGVVTVNVFHYALPFIMIAMFALAIYGLRHHKNLEVNEKQDKYFGVLLWPTLFFFVIASIASPYTDIRYLSAICGLMYIVVMFGLYKLLVVACEEKTRNIVMAAVIVVTAILPLPMSLGPGVEYSRWKEIVARVEENPEVPVLYLYDGKNNRFLDDILLFTKTEQSYVMRDQEYTKGNFEKVLAGKDLSKGLFVIANYGYGNRPYLDTLEEATGLRDEEYVFRLNAADVYFLK